MKQKKDMITMLLAGGQGSRLYVLTKEVAKPAVSFGGKYKIIDFPLSNCVNSGIDTVGVLTQYRPLELNSYIGNGQPWDLDRLYGGVHVLPPYQKATGSDWFKGTANAIYQHISFIDRYDPEYVIILSGDQICKQDCREFLNFHMVMERELMVKLVSEAFSRGLPHFIRDVLWAQRNELNLHAYKFEGYVSRIWSIPSYFEENMKLLDDENLDALFSNPVYTKVRDDNPTRYIVGAKVSNCILMQDTVVEADAKLEYIITDKNVTVTAGKELKGTDTYPVYIVKHGTV
jgi:ADP-glucose pyrophosphorylase